MTKTLHKRRGATSGRRGARSPDEGKGQGQQQSLSVWEMAESADSHFLFSLPSAAQGSPGSRGEGEHMPRAESMGLGHSGELAGLFP